MAQRPEVEDEFDYGDEGVTSPGGTKVVANQPHDEEVEISDDDGNDEGVPLEDSGGDGDVGGDIPHDMGGGGMAEMEEQEREEMQHDDDEEEEDEEEDEEEEDAGRSGGGLGGGTGAPGPFDGGPATYEKSPLGAAAAPDSLDAKDGGGAAGGDGSGEAGKEEGAYDPEDYKDLKVSSEISELFQYIGRYKPVPAVLETKLRPFIPDYIPSVGDIDEFIKVPRPDGKPDELGLKVLDEPAAKQSDATVLNLQMRAASKQAGLQPSKVSGLDRVDRNPKKLAEWISSVEELHKGRPRAAMAYSKPMPDVETLMQEWPPEVENVLARIRLPEGNLPVRLLSKLACTVTDIPVYNKPVESLHLFFSLYLAFKENPSFAHIE